MTIDDAQRETPAGDAALVDAARTGDAHAYAELFDRHRPAVEHLALALTRGASADGLVGAVFAAGLRRVLDGEPGAGALRPWLLRLTLDCHGAAVPESAAFAAFSALDARQQAVLWHDVVDGSSPELTAEVIGGTAAQVVAFRREAEEALRESYLAGQRERAATLHARTHLDDLAGHADSCATCLGLWWAADELASAPSLTAAVLGPAARRYLRQPVDRRAARVRPRWVPSTVVAVAALLLAATSAGTLAVAQWGPTSVPAAWRGLEPVPSIDAAPTPPPPAEGENEDENGPATPEPSEAPSPVPTTQAPSPSQQPSDEPSSPAPTTPEPSGPPEAMRVGFAFGDPDWLEIDGEPAIGINLYLVGEDAVAGERTATIRFDLNTSFTLLGASDGLSCTSAATTVTCTRTLSPGDQVSASVRIAAQEARGTARAWSDDTEDSPRRHDFSFVHLNADEDGPTQPTPGRPAEVEGEQAQ